VGSIVKSNRVTTDHQVLDLSVGELREEIVSTPQGLWLPEHLITKARFVFGEPVLGGR